MALGHEDLAHVARNESMQHSCDSCDHVVMWAKRHNAKADISGAYFRWNESKSIQNGQPSLTTRCAEFDDSPPSIGRILSSRRVHATRLLSCRYHQLG